MFTLSEIQNKRRAACSIALLNFGLAGSFLSILIRSPWKLAFAALVILSLAVYAWELSAILRARKRKAVDWGIRYFLSAVALLLPLSVLALVLSWPGLPLNQLTGQLENLYGFLGLLGAISLAIIGMLYKIVPFLVWFGRYSRHIGRAQVPALADMYSARLQAAGFWLYLAGLVVTGIGIVESKEITARWGCILLAGSGSCLLLNIGAIFSHLIKPRLRPFTPATSVIPKSFVSAGQFL